MLTLAAIKLDLPGKWHIKDLRLFLEGTRGTEATDMLFAKINRLIIHSLLSCQDVIINERHCFECYGYTWWLKGGLSSYAAWVANALSP